MFAIAHCDAATSSRTHTSPRRTRMSLLCRHHIGVIAWLPRTAQAIEPAIRPRRTDLGASRRDLAIINNHNASNCRDASRPPPQRLPDQSGCICVFHGYKPRHHWLVWLHQGVALAPGQLAQHA